MHAIVSGIDATNDASLRLHASFGFKEVAHFREVGHKFGRWLDLKFLQLILDGSEENSKGEQDAKAGNGGAGVDIVKA